MNPDEYSCFKLMTEWVRRIDEIFDLYDRERPYPFMSPANVTAGRELYTRLKNDLRDECKRLTHKRTSTEERLYYPFVNEALVHLDAPTNARPEKWHSSLYAARIDFSNELAWMQGRMDEVSNCRSRLNAYVVAINGIFAAYESSGLRSAQSLYKQFKEDIREDAKRLHREASEVEKLFYDRPVCHAAAHLTAATNASWEKIRERIGTAKADITLGLSRIEARFGTEV